MLNNAQDDDQIMSLVELALARPAAEREAYVRGACAGNPELCERVWKYVQWEERMNGFLLDPLLPAALAEHPFKPEPMDEHSAVASSASKLGYDFKGNERFEVIRCLGSGGMGVVYEVNDRHRDARVALKTLSKADPDAVYRFKNEFRTLAGITHPNLVSIYELLATADEWFFTMELVEGQDFLDYVGAACRRDSDRATTAIRASAAGDIDLDDAASQSEPWPPAARSRVMGPQCDTGRLRAAFSQLVVGVRAIHAAGKLHRDLKPSNVIVTPSGRVVILDFGLAVDLHHTKPGPAVTQIAIGGTPNYMSPEQAQGASLNEATDWYSAGVMLFEALTGRTPFPGCYKEEIIQRKLTLEAGRPSDFCDGVPDDLDLLCCDLLRLKVEQRPRGEEIVRRLGLGESQPPPSSLPSFPAVIVGREAPLGVMRAAFAHTIENGPAAVYVEGTSGMGKSALLDFFLGECARRGDTVVLSGRCNQQESVPFKALDVLIDSLGRYLRKLGTSEIAELLPRHVIALSQMFPTLLRVPAIAKAPRDRAIVKRDAIAYRQMASAALRELLSRITDRRRLVIAVDDLQWGDRDSAVLITGLLAPPDPPSVLFLAASRSEEEPSSPCLAYLRKDNPWCRRFTIRLEPLSAADVQEMSAGISETNRISADLARKIVRESGGNPLFIQEVLHDDSFGASGSTSVDDLIWRRVVRTDKASRRLLEVVSLSGRPLDLRLALQAAHLQEDSLPVYTALRNARLLRRVGVIEPEVVETYHDRIRETITSRIEPETGRAHHGQLALALQSTSTADPEHIAFHLENSGEQEQAVEYYARAAQRASAALAFDQAATLYDRMLRLSRVKGRARCDLLTRLAEAVANAGRSHQAAGLYEEAAGEASGAALLELKLRAAYYYCISGRIDEGKDAFRGVLDHVKLRLPSSDRKAVLALLVARIKLAFRGLRFEERNESELGHRERARIDAAWAAATGLGMVDLADAAYFTTKSVLLALDAGEPYRVARSLAWEAATSAYFGKTGRKRAEKLFRVCEELVEKTRNPHARGLLSMSRGICAFTAGRWKQARTLLAGAESILARECTGVAWELATTRVFSQAALIHLGEYAVLQQQCPEIIRDAKERGDLYTEVLVGATSQASAYCAIDQPELARKTIEELLAGWSRESMDTPQFLGILTGWYVDLYLGEYARVWERMAWEWPRSAKAGMFRGEYNRVMALWMRASAAISGAQASIQPREHWRAAEAIVKRMRRETVLSARPLASAMESALALGRGDTKMGVVCLERTIQQAEASDMLVILNCARFFLGAYVEGDNGRAMSASAEEWMLSHGIANPARFARANIPIFPMAGEGQKSR